MNHKEQPAERRLLHRDVPNIKHYFVLFPRSLGAVCILNIQPCINTNLNTQTCAQHHLQPALRSSYQHVPALTLKPEEMEEPS